ncbi:urease accessory protein UreF [Gilvimarinus sp. F26214L]|uniref:urease accessory protein UreF n=1 Tax=Gilvimarinus sp. DZF01 TaxID=3461371 RepID=UPI0040454ACD
MSTDAALLRLLHLASANLPVGAYAFSHGLEYAIDARWINNAREIGNWVSMQLRHSMATVDIPVVYRLAESIAQGDDVAIRYWNDFLLACRETRELQLSDTAAGEALQRLLPKLDVPLTSGIASLSFLTGFAHAAHHWNIDPRSAALGYVWSWLENQVVAATKLMPLGQAQAQVLLHNLQEQIPSVLDLGGSIADDQIGASLPGLTIASMCHENQYTRLFRS